MPCKLRAIKMHTDYVGDHPAKQEPAGPTTKQQFMDELYEEIRLARNPAPVDPNNPATHNAVKQPDTAPATPECGAPSQSAPKTPYVPYHLKNPPSEALQQFLVTKSRALTPSYFEKSGPPPLPDVDFGIPGWPRPKRRNVTVIRD